MQLLRPAATLVLLGFALQTSALTIGRPQGAAWIGKPLDLAIPLTLEDSEGGGSLCLEAEVLQGDNRVDDRRVTVSLEPGTSPGTSRAHVRSTVAMEEPVVTVTLRAGCDTKSIRRFVLFADLPLDAATVASSAAAARSAEGSGATPGRISPFQAARNEAAANAGAGSGSGFDSGASVPQPPPRRASPPRVNRPPVDAASRPAAPVAPPPRARVAAEAPTVRQPVRAPAPRVAASAAVPAPTSRAAGAPSGGARLQLDALEPAPQRASVPAAAPAASAAAPVTPSVAAPTPVVPLPGGLDEAARSAAAAAALRAATPVPSEDAQRESQRMQSLESTLNALREQTAQNQRTLLALRSELSEARESRYRNPLVYALIGLLLLALIAMAMMWRALRRATAPQWWGEGPPPTRSQFAALSGTEPPSPEPSEPPTKKGRSRMEPGSSFATLEPVEEEEVIDTAPAPLAATMAHPAQRMVNTEELFDVQQQSDFFLSLGQHDQAIAVLREHITVNPGTSALAYLDLLKIYHSLGRKEDYDRLRQEFSTNFNAGVPAFEKFEEAGRGLEHYRDTLARIEAQWPASGTLPLIEELVFRKPGNRDEDSFDLAAYRELLLLYSVAKEVIDPDSAPPAPVTPLSYADTHFHSPLSASGSAPLTTIPAVLATAPATLSDALTPLPPQLTQAPAAEEAEVADDVGQDTAPAALDAGPTMPTPLFASVDDGLHEQTVMAPDLPQTGPVEPVPSRPTRDRDRDRDIDFTEADRTAYETLPVPLEEPGDAADSASKDDPNSIDFQLFDPTTEAEIAPRKLPKKS